MKRLFLFVALAVATVACKQKDEPVVTPSLEVVSSSESLVALNEGGEVNVQFKTNVAWTASLKTPADWCSVSPKKGNAGENTLRLLFNENMDRENRSVIVVIDAQGLKKEVEVVQLQKDALVVSPTVFNVPSSGQEIAVRIGHNVDYQIEIDEDWVTEVTSPAAKSYVEEDIVFNVAANTLSEERTASITISAGDKVQVITINQEAHVPTLTFEIDGQELPSPEFWISSKGGTVVMTVNANFEYELSVAEGCEWLKVTRSGNEHSFEASPNAAYVYRSIEVIVTGWTESGVEGKQFYVFQSPREDSGESYIKYTAVDYNWTLTNTFVRLAQSEEYIIASNGGNVLKVFRKEDGSFVKDVTLDVEGLNIEMLTNDDAGNLVFGATVAHTPQGSQAPITSNIYYLESLDAEPVMLGKITNQNVYSSQNTCGLEVAGNVKENAILVLFTGPSEYYWLAFEVSQGAIVNNEYNAPKENFGPLPVNVWVNNYCASVCPLGSTLADGFIFSGYSFNKGYYVNNHVNKEAAAKELFAFDAAYANSAPTAIDIAIVDGKKYVAIGMGGFFGYSKPGVVVYDITDMDNVVKVCDWSGIPEYDTTHWVGTALGMADVLIVPTGGKCYDLYYFSAANEALARVVIEE